MTLLGKFQEERTAFMVAPFWFWNDDLEPDEIRRQVREMREQNVGGFFIHARVGRVTPYFSERWMECVRAAVDEAKQQGMKAWIYDEDNWPSGYAGGAVVEQGDEVLQRYAYGIEVPLNGAASIDLMDPKYWTEKRKINTHGVIAAYVGTKEGGEWTSLERLDDGRIRDNQMDASGLEGDTALVMFLELDRYRREFAPECVTHGYIDVLDKDVVQRFLDHTYEGYKRQIGAEFGKTVPGFFIDEPSYHDTDWAAPVLRLPWTGKLPESYRALNGRDLLDDLPSVFFEVGDHHKVRHDYYRVVTRLFVENYTKPIAEWCEANGVDLTGHFILEECLRAAVQTIGNAMEHYEYQQAPGIDHLGQYIDLAAFWSSSRVLCKQVASVAHQFKRERVMVETYAGGGWDFGVLEQKWMSDWMIALGINLIVPHAFHYSLRGYRKRDYPPSLGYQQPWWPMSKELGSHFARLNWLMTQGEHVTDIAVLHPMNSIRATHDPQGIPWEMDPYTDCFEKLTKTLLDNQLDFDYLDEELLARHGAVEGGTITLKHGRYKVVIVPYLLTIRRETLNLLEQFADNGGDIVVIEPLPKLLDGETSPEPARFLEEFSLNGSWHSPETYSQLVNDLRYTTGPMLHVPLRTSLGEQIVCQHRRTNKEDIFFLASAARHQHLVPVALDVGPDKVAEFWDTVTGNTQFAGAPNEDGYITLILELDFGRSYVIVVRDRKGRIPESDHSRGAILDSWEYGSLLPYELDVPNSFVLDHPRLSIDGGDWSDPTWTLKAQPIIEEAAAQGATVIRARYDFEARSAISSSLMLLTETPEQFKIELDGKTIEPVDSGWYPDISLRKIPLADGLDEGHHSLTLEFSPGTELEPCYLHGDFGVYRSEYGTPYLDNLPDFLDMGSWDNLGLMNYAGRVTYHLDLDCPKLRKNEEPWLIIPRVSKCFAVEVNGKRTRTVHWPPYEVSLAGMLKPGKNVVKVIVANSARNFYGPHHLKHEETIDCLGPGEVREKRRYTPEIITMPAGILESVSLVVRQKVS